MDASHDAEDRAALALLALFAFKPSDRALDGWCPFDPTFLDNALPRAAAERRALAYFR